MVPFWGTELVLNGAIFFILVFEWVTYYFRFILGMEGTKFTRVVGKFTGGLRIHHGYIGVLLVLTRNWFPTSTLPIVGDWQQLASMIGWGCILSDGIHHFYVLYPYTGSHDFDLVYPENSFPRLTELQEKCRRSLAFIGMGIFGTMFLGLLFILAPR